MAPGTTPTTVPQEIVNEIIAHLAGDLPALRQCSLTSLSLYRASRNYVFSIIYLYTPFAAARFNSLLKQSPDIGSLVRTIHIYTLPHERHSTLPTILPRLSRVRKVVIGHEARDDSMYWRALPPATKQALEALVCSPILHTLIFKSIFYLPTSIIAYAAHVKVLELYSVVFAEPGPGFVTPGRLVTPAPTLTPSLSPLRLESILCSGSTTNSPFQLLYAPNLRHCIIVGNSTANILTMHRMCLAVTPACETDSLTLLDYRGDDSCTYVDPGVLVVTRRLAFVTWTFNSYWRQRIDPMWSSIARLLENESLGALENFSVRLRCTPDLPWLSNMSKSTDNNNNSLVDEGYAGASRLCWARLDAILGDSVYTPRLRHVELELEIVGGETGLIEISDVMLRRQLGKCLPLLQERGLGMMSARLLHSKIWG